VRRRLDGVVEEADGRGEPGRRNGRRAARPWGGRGRPEVGGDPDMRAPLAVRERGMERNWAGG
jgi:hypothetical protein